MSDTQVTLKIGVALAGSVGAAFGNLKGLLGGVKLAIGTVTEAQAKLTTAIKAAATSGVGGVSRLKREYEALGRTLQTLEGHQARLNAVIARGAQLHAQRAAIKGELMDTVGTGAVLGMPAWEAVKHAIDFDRTMTDTAITGALSPQAQASMGAMIRKTAVTYGQPVNEVAEGSNLLVREGLKGSEVEQYIPSLGKVATALNAAVPDLARTVYTLDTALGIKGDKAQAKSWDAIGYGERQGVFKIHELGPALREIAPSFAATGTKGDEALRQIVAALQISRKTTATEGEAATNVKSWLSHMTSQHLIRAYAMAGVNYPESMKNMVASGKSPFEGSLEIASAFVKNVGGKDIAQRWQKAGGDPEQQEKLMERFRASGIIMQQEQMNFLVAYMLNKDTYKDIKKGMADKATGTVDTSLEQREETTAFKVDQAQASWGNTLISAGKALTPVAEEVLATIAPLITQFEHFTTAHPGVVRGVVKLTMGFLGLKAAGLGLRWVTNFFIASPWNTGARLITGIATRFSLLRLIFTAGSGRMIAMLRLIGLGARQAGVLAPVLGRIGSAARILGTMLGGPLVKGIRLVGITMAWAGRLMLTNPIILIITGIAVAAFLIYRYWTPIKAFFANVWQGVTRLFTAAWARLRGVVGGGIGGILTLLAAFSPLALLVKGFSAALGWLWGKLPANFRAAGEHLVEGLIHGITGMLGKAKAAVVSMAHDVSGWFKDALGIQSPSRLFMGHGGHIVDGAVLGIRRQQPTLRRTMLALAASTAIPLGAPTMATPVPPAPTSRADSAATVMHITFAPQITVHGEQAAAVRQAVDEAMALAQDQFERRLRELTHRQQRTTFADRREV